MRRNWKGPVRHNEMTGRNYEKCHWSIRWLLAEGIKCAAIVAGLSYFFYRSIWACIPLGIVGIRCWKRDSCRKVKKDRRQLLLQFCDMTRYVSAAMAAGYSLENAFWESYDDMGRMHGRESVICRELNLIRQGMVMNLPLEELLEDLGRRSGTEQIREFSALCSITKNNGGSMTDVIRSFTELIHRQRDMEEEIMAQTASRRMEQYFMSLIPFAILLYVEAGSKGYFDMLYHNLSGVAIMSICLSVYLGACCLSDRILDKAVSV